MTGGASSARLLISLLQRRRVSRPSTLRWPHPQISSPLCQSQHWGTTRYSCHLEPFIRHSLVSDCRPEHRLRATGNASSRAFDITGNFTGNAGVGIGAGIVGGDDIARSVCRGSYGVRHDCGLWIVGCSGAERCSGKGVHWRTDRSSRVTKLKVDATKRSGTST